MKDSICLLTILTALINTTVIAADGTAGGIGSNLVQGSIQGMDATSSYGISGSSFNININNATSANNIIRIGTSYVGGMSAGNGLG